LLAVLRKVRPREDCREMDSLSENTYLRSLNHTAWSRSCFVHMLALWNTSRSPRVSDRTMQIAMSKGKHMAIQGIRYPLRKGGGLSGRCNGCDVWLRGSHSARVGSVSLCCDPPSSACEAAEWLWRDRLRSARCILRPAERFVLDCLLGAAGLLPGRERLLSG